MSLFDRLRASVNSTGTASPISTPKTLIDRLREYVLAPTTPLVCPPKALSDRLRESVRATTPLLSAPKTHTDRLRESVVVPITSLLSDEPSSVSDGLTISEREKRRRVKGLVDGSVAIFLLTVNLLSGS